MAVTDIVIRPFQSEDLVECQEMFRSVYESYGYIDDYAEKTIASDMADIQSNYMNVPGGHWWVAVSAEKHIIGQIAILPLSVGDRKCFHDLTTDPSSFLNISPDRICELRRFAVLPIQQRKGLGFQLLQMLISYAQKDMGYEAIHLTTLTSMQSACCFYDKYGFKRGKVERYNLNFDSNNRVFYTKSTTFQDISDLTEDDLLQIERPMQESFRIYVQHFWMTFH